MNKFDLDVGVLATKKYKVKKKGIWSWDLQLANYLSHCTCIVLSSTIYRHEIHHHTCIFLVTPCFLTSYLSLPTIPMFKPIWFDLILWTCTYKQNAMDKYKMLCTQVKHQMYTPWTHFIHISSCVHKDLYYSCMTIFSCYIQRCL